MFYCFRPSTKKGFKDWGHLCIGIHENNRKHIISTRIMLRKTEWRKYYTGNYVPSNFMYSQKIKYGAFAVVLSQLKSLVLDEPDLTRVPYIIFSAKEAIKEYQAKRSAPQVKAEPDPVLFTDFFAQYVEDLKSGKRLKYKSTEKVAKATSDGFGFALRTLRKYENERKHRYSIDEISMEWQRCLLQWFINRGCLPNTLTNMMLKVRLVMKAAHEQNLTKNRDFMRRDFVPRKEDVENVFLTPDMIEELENLDLYTNEGYREAVRNSELDDDRKDVLLRGPRVARRWTLLRTKDLFLLGCYTGQRYSDYSRLNERMIVELGGRKFIKLIQVKTGKKVMIPLDRRILPILKKHGGQAPKILDSTLNHNMKLIGEILGWTWEPDFDETHMGKKAGPRFCDMISSHTARRTFASNAYAAGVPLSSIMAVTGHSTEEKLRVYLKLQPQDKALMATRDFEGYIDKYKK